MGAVPVLKSKSVVNAYLRMGYVQRSTKGSHVVMTKGVSSCCIPYNSKLPKGTLRRVLKQSGVPFETLMQNIK